MSATDQIRPFMRPQRVDRPFAVFLIAGFQFLKAGFLLAVAVYLWLGPEGLPHTEAFSELFFIAAHGKNLPGVLVPVFGCYVAYTGFCLLRLKRSTRRALALSSAITICVSLDKLGLFTGDGVTSPVHQETLYILILLDLAVYIYLAFHPEIARSFNRRR
jgi:hypothetical protein